MPRTIRFHLDEHVSNAVAEGLRRRDIDVTTTADARLIAANDDAQFSFAVSAGRILVTHDDDLLRRHARGGPHAGIAFCHGNARSIGEMIRKLELIGKSSNQARW
jgi:predicted nuclease of predicted toxin-antitoxin system